MPQLQEMLLNSITGDQLLPTQYGFLRAQELYFSDESLVLVGSNNYVTAHREYQSLDNVKLLKIHTIEGYTHTVVPKHQIALYNGEIREVENLFTNDQLALQRIQGMWGTQDLQKEAFLAGLSYNGTLNEVYYVEFDYELLSRIQTMANVILEKYNLKNDIIYAKVAKGRMSITSRSLTLMFKMLGFYLKNSIPDFVLRSNKQTVVAFLKSIYYSNAVIHSGTSCSLLLNNNKLLQDIQIVLLNFGIKVDRISGEIKHNHAQSCKLLEENLLLGSYKKHQDFIDNSNNNVTINQEMYATFSHLEEISVEIAFGPDILSDDDLWSCNGFLTKT